MAAKLSDIVQSAEFALVARVSSVAAVIIGLLASGLMGLGGLMLSEIRGDLKETAAVARKIETRTEVHESRLGMIERRQDRIEAAIPRWNPNGPAAVYREPGR